MDKHILTFAFPFPSNSTGGHLYRLAQELCRHSNLKGKEPRMGPHATIIPPFYCTTSERRLIALLVRSMWKFSGKTTRVPVKGFNVFDPPLVESDIGALYLEMEIDEGYREFIERHKLDWPLEFTSPLASSNATDRVWIPHMSLLEGPNLHVVAKKLLPELNEYVVDKYIEYGEPLFFEKHEKGSQKWWAPVLL